MVIIILTALLIIFSLLLFAISLKRRTNSHTGRPFAQQRTSPDVNLDKAQKDKLIAFLEEADDAYIHAYQYRSLGELIHFTTKDLAIEMQQKITYYNDKIWASPAHRHRTWTVISTDGLTITVRKELTFKNVKYGRILVKIGDDCVEYWKVIFDNIDKCYKIQEIIC